MEDRHENDKLIIETNPIPFYKKKVFIISSIVSISVIAIITVVLIVALPGEKMCQLSFTHCFKCDKVHISQCGECNPGYYMPSDDQEKTNCKECTFENCANCTGTSNFPECIKCKERYNAVYKNGKIESCNRCEIGEGDKCLTCIEDSPQCSSCNPGYNLSSGGCFPFYIEAEYETTNDNETIYLIYGQFQEIQMNIFINGSEQNLNSNEYTFEKSGKHSVTLLSPPVKTLNGLFENNNYIISASIIDNTLTIWSLERIFSGATNLISANLSGVTVGFVSTAKYLFRDCHKLQSFIIPKSYEFLRTFDGMFQNCYSITSIDFNIILQNSNLDVTMENTFKNCKNLKNINFENTQLRTIVKINSMFNGRQSLSSVDVSNLVFGNSLTEDTMSYLFFDCYKLSLIDISSINAVEVERLLIFEKKNFLLMEQL